MLFENTKTEKKVILITGGAGFIGSHLVRLFVNKYPDYIIVNLDKLTYAGNLANLKDIENKENYIFVQGDICDVKLINDLFEKYQFDGVIHTAAESHVDRSIMNPMEFVLTNIIGSVTLLNIATQYWNSTLQSIPISKRFLIMSTDEVFGSLGSYGYFTEQTRYDPQSPYAASKASADHFGRAFNKTFGLPVLISNCSNNYGPYQFPEKLIPLTINNIVNHRSIPIYGKGENIRDWISVEDHVNAIDTVFHKGEIGETYTIGCKDEWKNLDLVKLLCTILDKKLKRPNGESEGLITFVKDRDGHDKRYAIESVKLRIELGWKPSVQLYDGLQKTVDWYLENVDWVENITSGSYRQYYDRQYNKR